MNVLESPVWVPLTVPRFRKTGPARSQKAEGNWNDRTPKFLRSGISLEFPIVYESLRRKGLSPTWQAKELCWIRILLFRIFSQVFVIISDSLYAPFKSSLTHLAVALLPS